MKVAHLTAITPGRCGLYETSRDLVAGLRARGVDSRLVDPDKENNKLYPKETSDRGVPFAEMEWAKDADVLVSHSGIGKDLEKTNQPLVHVAHGRPRHSFMSEVNGSTPIYSYHYRLNQDARLKTVVTFWPQHVDYLKVMFPEKPVKHVQSSVDLQAWTPGSASYNFNGQGGKYNIVCTDSWRDDIDLFVPLNAFAMWAREVRGAKLHIYGAPNIGRGWGALIKRIQDDGNMGEINGWVKGLNNVYRSANATLTAHEIDVRTVRESMASGCPVIRVKNDISNYRTLFANALETNRAEVRAEAQRLFDHKETAKQFHEILETI